LIAQGAALGTEQEKPQALKGRDKTREFHRCLILDPAAGTGTFLYDVIQTIYDTIRRPAKGAWPEYVRDHLLPRLFGFELMVAPYAIAHMKLGLALAETGYDFSSDERLRVFLTNTLQEAEEMTDLPLFGQWLADEAKEANEVKRELPIMVVLGNPPYSGHSANASEITQFIEPNKPYSVQKADGSIVNKIAGNKGTLIKRKNFIGQLLLDYYIVDGQPLGEKNSKWLQDDYVKFIRFAQWRIEQTGSGILAFITNHGYLDNPTFRGMRQNLMNTFSDIYILNLHGNSKKKETCPDGSEDKNVFDIQQGVSIGIFVKQLQSSTSVPACDPSALKGRNIANVYHADLYGKRQSKYDWLNTNNVNQTQWREVIPQQPFYLFVPQDDQLRSEYEHGMSLSEVMPQTLLGPNSHRDGFAIAFDEKTAKKRINDLADKRKTDDEIRRTYQIVDTRDWSLSKARNANLTDKEPIACLYRPFDFRFMLYGPYAFDYHRPEINDHLLRANQALISTRQTKESFSVLSTNKPVGQHKLATPYDGSYVSPLYLYPPKEKTGLFEHFDWPAGKDGRVPNLSVDFVNELSSDIGLKFVTDGRGDLKKTFGPEDIFNYIYAVFHSPTYRKKYAEFLKIDFPRVPMPKSKELFIQLAKVGEQLSKLHLMESDTLENDRLWPKFAETGENTVESGYPKFVGSADAPDKGRVFINKDQYFEGIRQDVWEFMIGGYQVCEKWLKDRRGRKLTFEDINHYQKITVALAETIRLMQSPCLKEQFE
jgi:predicted helicase